MSTDNARHNDDFFVAGFLERGSISPPFSASRCTFSPSSTLSLSFRSRLGHVSPSPRSRTQLKRGYKVSILRRRVPASSCFPPWEGVSCRFRRRTERFRELMRSKLVSGRLWTLVPQVHIFFDIFFSRNNEENIGDREKWLFFSFICRNQSRARAWDERFGKYSKAAGLSSSTWWTRTFLACVDFFLLQRLAINPFDFLYAA